MISSMVVFLKTGPAWTEQCTRLQTMFIHQFDCLQCCWCCSRFVHRVARERLWHHVGNTTKWNHQKVCWSRGRINTSKDQKAAKNTFRVSCQINRQVVFFRACLCERNAFSRMSTYHLWEIISKHHKNVMPWRVQGCFFSEKRVWFYILR